MHIRLAKENDLSDIMSIIQKSVALMEKNNNDQWTGEYPQDHDFLEDIKKGTMYVAVLNDQVVGSVSIDQNEPEEYASVDWRKEGEAFLFHRLAVDPDTRGEGVASKLITFSEEHAVQHGVFYMKVDTYSLNKKAQSLFTKLGYEKRGEIMLYGKDKPFYCYDKMLKSK